MRAILDMDTVQIEITNACWRDCSNCTRFCGHMKPFFLDEFQFREAVDSMVGFPKMVGIMGGEPLLHPQFEKFCTYIASKIPKKQLGLWTSLPPGYEHHRAVICNTFEHIFINDHSRDDIYHCPILVAAEEVFKHKHEMFYAIDHCWLQNSWSASINPNGAFFCEVAASMSLLFDGPKGWPVEPGWWWRTPKDFKHQIEWYCPKCGAALPLPRRLSIDGRDDISPGNLERLKNKSRKIKKGKYVVSDLKLVKEPEPMAAYKDTIWRNRVASRYGICLTVNEQRFWTPHLVENWKPPERSLFEEFENAA